MTVDERFDRIEQLIENLIRHGDERFDGIVQRFDGVDQRFDGIVQRFDGIVQRFDSIVQRFDSIDQRFDSIDQRLDGIDQRLDGIDQRFAQVDQRFDRIDHSIENLTERVDRLEASVQSLTRYFMEFRSEALSRFQLIEARLDVPMSIAQKAEAQLSQVSTLTKVVNEIGAVSTQLSAAQWKHTDNTLDLEKRVAKLEEIVSKLLKPAA
jgi:chromosome segregation ATPase